MTISNKLILPALFAPAFIGVITILLATKPGVGITPDSTVYIDAARNLAGGRGLVAFTSRGDLKPLTHYPPFYASVLASLSTTGLSIENAARWLNAFLFGANIFLVGWALSQYAKDSFWLPLLGSFLTLTGPDIAGIHTFALTEPVFLFFALLGLIHLAIYLDNGRRSFLISSAIAIAAAFSTRYVGIVLVFTGAAALLTSKGPSALRRVGNAFLFAALACLPMALWALRNQQVAAETTDRAMAFHPLKPGQIVSGISTISSWLLLGKVRGDLRALGFLIQVAIIIALLAYVFMRRRATVAKDTARFSLQRLPVILSIFIVSNILFLIFTASFIDADTVLDDRSLVVSHVAALILVSILFWKRYRSSSLTANLRIAFVVMALAFAGSYSLRWTRWFTRTSADGQGYASRGWKESETIARVRMLPAGTPLYSNGYDAIYYLTGRPAIYLPEKVTHGSGRVNQNYEVELQRMKIDLKERRAVVVYFDTLPERWFLPAERELRTRLSLTPLGRNMDGSISAGK